MKNRKDGRLESGNPCIISFSGCHKVHHGWRPVKKQGIELKLTDGFRRMVYNIFIIS